MDWSNSIGPLRGVYRGRNEVVEFWMVKLYQSKEGGSAHAPPTVAE